MNRVTAQQAGTFEKIISSPFPHNRRPDTQFFAAPRFLHQNTGQQAADTAETVQHNILRFRAQRRAAGIDAGQFLEDEIINRDRTVQALELDNQFAQINTGRGKFKFGHRFDQREGFRHGKLFINNKPGEPVGFKNIDHRTVYQGTAIHRRYNIILTVHSPDNRQHLLGTVFLGLPVLKIHFLFFCTHDFLLPLVRCITNTAKSAEPSANT